MTQWDRFQRLSGDVKRLWSLRWTSPTFMHEIWVQPEQETAAAELGAQAFSVLVLCHLMVDALPMPAYPELVETLSAMREFYLLPESASSTPLLRSGKRAPRLSSTVRREIDEIEE